MDIAVIGPEKFAFQDMASIELALSYRDFGPLSLIPEKDGGEDANLFWTGGVAQTLEVQVKGAKGTAGLVELVKYLAHYPSRQTVGSLLERLMDAPQCHTLFILTARCKDELAELLIARPIVGRPAPRQVSRALASALQMEINRQAKVKAPKGATALTLARRSDMDVLSQRPIEDFEKALAKVGIAEQETAETIEVRLHASLRADRFDTLSIRGILARLSDLLGEAKRSQADAFIPMLTELAERAPTAVKPRGYLDRGIESDLEQGLATSKFLALVGPPRAGKTWTARAIAGRLQEEGFEVRQGGHIDEAERFLTDAVGAERLYVLDDPLGSREPVPDASARLAALTSLATRIPENRRLIVAQSEHVLLQTRGAVSLGGCTLGGQQWIQLMPLSPAQATDVWLAAANDQGLDAAAIARVKDLIGKEPSLRDPGSLSYLAQTWTELHSNPLDEEIRLQASRDASDFARTLAMQLPGAREVLTASALGTLASNGVADGELAFILDGGDERPGLAPEISIVSFGDDPRPPPAYSAPRLIEGDKRHALETLQRRRVIEQRDTRYNFTHPYLRAGAQTLTTPEIEADSRRLVEQVERAIACASPATSLAAARNLRWLRLALGPEHQDMVFQTAIIGLRSLFPATRDCCFELLLELADELPADVRDEVPYWSRRVSIKLEDIDVRSGIGFISNQPELFPEASQLAEVQPYLDAMEQGQTVSLDLSLSKRLLQTLKIHPTAMTAAAARRFLSADEAVVRAAAARVWCRKARQSDDDILERIRDDAAPAVGIAVLRALVTGWQELESERRDRLLSILGSHARSAGSASMLFSLLVRFNREEQFGESPPWQVFATLMPAIIGNLPISVSFSDGRFSSALEEAITCRGSIPAGPHARLRFQPWASPPAESCSPE